MKKRISKFSKEAKRLLDEQDTEEVLVMVDFLFGSPFNEFSKLAAGYAGKMEIITGVNLPALVEAVNCQEDGSSMETVIPQIKRSCGNENFKRDTCRRRKWR